MFILKKSFIAFFWLLTGLGSGVVVVAQHSGSYRKVSYDFGPDAPSEVVGQWLEGLVARRLRPGATLIAGQDRSSPGGRSIVFDLFWEGLPVFDLGVKVMLNPQGRAVALLDQLLPFTQPARSYESPPDLVAERYVLESGPGQYPVVYGWKYAEGQLIPMARIDLHPQGQAWHYRAWVHAPSGVEAARETLNTLCKPLDADTPGLGRVFLPDPCTRSETTYGMLFTDNNDQHSPVFDLYIDTVTLRDLHFENNLFHLQGPHVHIQDLAPRTVAPVTSSDGVFFYNRDSAGFEDVMVYFHIDAFQRYVQSLGFFNLRNDPIAADPHGMGNSDNSSYVPGVRHLLFGEGGVDDAEDADVIVHEYIHALSDAASPNTNTGRERRGLDEGIADYFAAAYSYDTNPFNWFKLYNWDGHNEFWAGRVATSTQMYPPENTNIYRYGEIWASTLMELRQEIGAAVMDRLALQQMYGNFQNMTLPDAALLLLDADSALYGGAHSLAISQAFCRKQVLIGPSCLAVRLDPLWQETPWQIRLLPDGNAHISGPAHAEARVEIFGLDGRNVFAQMVRDQDRLAPGTASGIYLIRLYPTQSQPISAKWIWR